MKMKSTVLILHILLLSLPSCSNSEAIGKWDDIIKLSQKEVLISAESSKVMIRTEGTFWWLNGVGLNNDWNYELDGKDTTKDNFIIEENQFTIERKNSNEIHISLTKNTSKTQRTLIISLQAGNYFDSIKIVQSADSK